MTAVRVLLAALLAASVAQAAPAPLPRPDRDRPTEAQMRASLRQMGLEVDVSVGFRPGTWVATIWLPGRRKKDDRPPSMDDLIRVVRLEAKDQRAVLRAILAGKVIDFDFLRD
jgi:hypothetical protein